MIRARQKISGVTLLEVLLVLVISSAILLMLISFTQQKTEELQRTRISLQLQQILNAGLAYFAANGRWPDTIQALQTAQYLPSTPLRNPWGNEFKVYGRGDGMFYVTTNVGSKVNAQITAGRLPFGFIADETGAAGTPPSPGTCDPDELTDICTYVVGSVNMPGQNLNNATSVNFASLYHNGACVPVPKCPSSNMVPNVMVIPVHVTGISEPCTNCMGGAIVRPITSFIGYAKGPSSSPDPCWPGGETKCFLNAAGDELPAGNYWRVCLRLETTAGVVNPTRTWGPYTGTVLAITRCDIPEASTGKTSGFDVWTR